uniref:Uncharacterized protein n=1 Tax=Caenorhabditis japonica TaxID=281687 RepID=A0A8R1IPQ8_CAEJA
AIYTRVMQLTIPSTDGPEGQSKQQ